MIQDLVEVAVDVLMPGGAEAQRRQDPNTVAVLLGGGVTAFREGLNQSGWLADEVLAAGALRQGKPPTLLTAATGMVFLQMARRRSKLLPREFVFAATADRVAAFAMTSEGGDTSPTVIKIKRGEIGSWPRELVRLLDPAKSLFAKGATLEVAGERFPITWDDDDSTNELVGLLLG